MNKDYLSRMIDLIDEQYLHQALSFPQKAKFRLKKVAVTAASIALIVCMSALAIYCLKPKSDSVYIPKLEIPSSSDNHQSDMLGIIIYNGRVYMQAEYIDYNDNPSVKNLADKYLGTADGSIGNSCINPSSKSTQKKPQKNFASNVTGNVYSVKGYDKGFRICIPEMYEGCGFMAFFECLNDISFSRGSDIFGDRLHLIENFNRLYKVDADTDKKSLTDLGSAAVSNFMHELYRAKAVEQINSEKFKIFSFSLKDGTSAQIRTYENGYAAYGQCCVKFNDISAFNLLYEYQ